MIMTSSPTIYLYNQVTELENIKKFMIQVFYGAFWSALKKTNDG